MLSFFDRPPIKIDKPVLFCKTDTLTGADVTYNTTAITASGTAGTNTITVSSSTTLKEGMYIALDTAGGENAIITTIAGTTVTLLNNLVGTYAGVALFIGGIGVLPDVSGEAHHLLQGSGTSQPALIDNFYNGKNAIYFDGLDDYLNASFPLTQPYTIYALLDYTIGAQQFLWDGDTGVNWTWARLMSNRDFQMDAGARFEKPTRTESKRLITAIYDGTNSYMNVNNEQYTGSVGTINPNGLTLSRINAPGVDFAFGYFLEVRVYASHHNRRQVKYIRNQIAKYYA